MDEIKFKDTTFFISRILKDEAIFCNKETYERLVNLINAFNELEEENEQLRKENTALDNENAEHLADNIRELELLEKLTKFLHECGLTNEQRALFREMITEEDLQPNLEHQTWKWKNE